MTLNLTTMNSARSHRSSLKRQTMPASIEALAKFHRTLDLADCENDASIKTKMQSGLCRCDEAPLPLNGPAFDRARSPTCRPLPFTLREIVGLSTSRPTLNGSTMPNRDISRPSRNSISHRFSDNARRETIPPVILFLFLLSSLYLSLSGE